MLSTSDARKAARALTTAERRAGVIKGPTSKEQQSDTQVFGGRTSKSAREGGAGIASKYAAIMNTAQGRTLARNLAKKGQLGS